MVPVALEKGSEVVNTAIHRPWCLWGVRGKVRCC